MARGSTKDPIQAFRFQVRIPAVSTSGNIGFVTVSGLNRAVDVVEYREGIDAITVRKMPGLVTFDNITFTRGMLKGDELLADWFDKMNNTLNLENNLIGGKDFRTNIEIDVLDRQDSAPFKRYQVINAFPVNLSFSDFDANAGDAVIQTMEVAHEGIIDLHRKGGGAGSRPTGQ